MPGIPPIKGTRLRATKIDSCGKPVSGPRNMIVTAGFVSVNLTAVNQDAKDLTQENAEGVLCFQDRTKPQRRWYTPAIELCNVNTGLLTMFTGWQSLLDINNNAVGYRDNSTIETDYGVMIEIWTAGAMDNNCPNIPSTDAALATTGSGKSYGYFLFGGTEWLPGDIKIGAEVSTFTLTGRTRPIPYWGMGPYNVQEDASGNPRRLVTPTGSAEHLTAFRTTIAPPAVTPGSEPVSLSLSGTFTGSNYYYGGPAGQPPITVAPTVVATTTKTLTVTGTPTGGAIGVSINNNPAQISATATAAQAAAALVALDDGLQATDITVTGGPLPTAPLVISVPASASLTLGANSLTGGTNPGATLA